MFKRILFVIFLMTLSGCGIPPFDDPSEEDSVVVKGDNNSVYYRSVNLEALNNNQKEEIKQ